MKIIAKNIEKSFGKNKVLHNATFAINPGDIHAFMGENGAGKSTLMNILVGDLQFDGGEIYFDDEKVIPYENPSKKISFIRQELNLVNDMTIYDNMFLGKMNSIFTTDKEYIRQTLEIFRKLNIDLDPRKKISTLSIGQQQLVEIAKGLIEECEVLIMDEPTAALTDSEIETLFKIIKNLAKNGVAIVYISHRMKEIFEISNKITVMRDGHYITKYKTSEVTEDELIASMVGRESVVVKSANSVKSDKEILNVDNISNKVLGYKNINFCVKEGEVFAIAGLMGSKRTEILETIFNLHKVDSGTIAFMGEQIDNLSIKKTIEKGLAFVTEDRKNKGLHLMFSIEQNIGMANSIQISENGFLVKAKLNELSTYFIERLNIKCDNPKQLVSDLSGGNQQKVVIGKWLSTMPKLLILDEPTRGIDINAKREIYSLINKLKSEGIAILMVSSEMSETLLLADRIMTINEGKQTAIINNENLTEELLLDYMIGERNDKED